MKGKNFFNLTIAALLFSMMITSNLQAVPGMINYQGKVESGGVPFTGNGAFMFAVVNGSGSSNYLWSNDGNFPPTTSFPIAGIADGLYDVILGQAPMQTIAATVFGHEDIYLRIWFNDGTHGFQQMTPDQQIVSVGFALKAMDADSLQGQSASNFAEFNHDHSFSEISGSASDDQISDTHTHTAGSIPAASINIYNLDSDKLDGIHGDQFLRSDQSDTMNGSLTISNNMYANESIGVGTTTPSDKFTLLNGEASLLRTDGGESILNFGSSLTGDVRYAGRIAYNHSSNRMSFSINSNFSTPELSLFNGNLGVGLLHPSIKLHVVQSNLLGQNLGDTQDIVALQCNSGNSIQLLTNAVRLNQVSIPTHNGHAFRIQRIVDVTKQGYIQFGSAYPGYTDFVGIGLGDDDVMRVTNGRVGIGTLAPATKLVVQDGAMSIFSNADPLFTDQGGTILFGPVDGTTTTATGGIFSGWQTIGNPTVGMFVTRDNARHGIQAEYHGNVKIKTSGQDRLTVDINGQVGVGTSTPGTKFDVRGNVAAEDEVRAHNPNDRSKYAYMNWDNGGDRARIGGFLSGVGVQPLFIEPGSATFRDGCLGIGTVSPWARLSITDGLESLALMSNHNMTMTCHGSRRGITVNATDSTNSIFQVDNNVYGGSAYFDTFWVKANGHAYFAGSVEVNQRNQLGDASGFALRVNGDIYTSGEYICPSADIAEKLPVHPEYCSIEAANNIENPNADSENVCESAQTQMLEPGDVVVITNKGIAPCRSNDDTKLAGIISTKPAVKMASEEVGQYVALAGKVPCKVVGPVNAGDLLTTSSVEGHAQSTDNPVLGAVVGKALEDFDGDQGVINVWVGGF